MENLVLTSRLKNLREILMGNVKKNDLESLGSRRGIGGLGRKVYPLCAVFAAIQSFRSICLLIRLVKFTDLEYTVEPRDICTCVLSIR